MGPVIRDREGKLLSSSTGTPWETRACNKALAAQDFRHICQGDNESVADFIRRMEHTFKVAYGRDSMSQETRNALLHGQLQDGLRYEIMKAPAVSGAQTYSELCLASRNEEKRLLELKKRLQYRADYNGRLPGIFPTKSIELPVESCLSGHNSRSLLRIYKYVNIYLFWRAYLWQTKGNGRRQ